MAMTMEWERKPKQHCHDGADTVTTASQTADIGAAKLRRNHAVSSRGRVQSGKVSGVPHSGELGQVPVCRIAFGDDRATISYVSPKNGSVRLSDRMSRIHTAIASLHEFMPLKLFTESDKVRKGLLILLSLVGGGVVVSGYYLALKGKRA